MSWMDAFRRKIEPIGINELKSEISGLKFDRDRLISRIDRVENEMMDMMEQLSTASGFRTEVIIQELGLKKLEFDAGKSDFIFYNNVIQTYTKSKTILESAERRAGITKRFLSMKEKKALRSKVEQAQLEKEKAEDEIAKTANQISQDFTNFTSAVHWNDNLSGLRSMAESMQNARAKGNGKEVDNVKEQMHATLKTMFPTYQIN